MVNDYMENRIDANLKHVSRVLLVDLPEDDMTRHDMTQRDMTRHDTT